MDEFRATQQQARGPGLSGWWDRVIPVLTDEQTGSLTAAADDPTISHRTISVVLGRWGHPVSPGMVGHWRRNVR